MTNGLFYYPSRTASTGSMNVAAPATPTGDTHDVAS
jgi:hypothetical protein